MSQTLILGSLVAGAYAVSQMEKNHKKVEKVGAYHSRRAVDPLTVDKGTSPGLGGHQPAPHTLRGLYAGTGRSDRNTRDLHLRRGVIQCQDASLSVSDRYNNILRHVGLGHANAVYKAHNLFGQGRPHQIGNDYKPITAQLKEHTSVSVGMMAEMNRRQQAEYLSHAPPTPRLESTGEVHKHAYLGNETINKSRHYEPKQRRVSGHPFKEMKNYLKYRRGAGRPGHHGRMAQKSGHIYL